MWITRRLSQSPRDSAPASARVTQARGGLIDAVGAYEHIGTPSVMPYGFTSLPAGGEEVLVAQAQGFDICLGAISGESTLAPGEVLIRSSGGAAIHLKNNGDVIINGLIITSGGELISP